PGAPLGAGVDADLADHVEDLAGRAAPAQDHRVVAVVEARRRGLVGLGQDRGRRRGRREDEDVAVRDGSGEVHGGTGGGGSVEVELHDVAVRGQVDGCAGAVVQLQRLVVRGAFDVLGYEQVGRRGGGCAGQAQDGTGGDRDRQGGAHSARAHGTSTSVNGVKRADVTVRNCPVSIRWPTAW